MKRGIFRYTLIIYALTANNHLYAADDYLSILENESLNTRVDSAAENAEVIEKKKQKALAGSSTEPLPANLNKNDFKIFLMDNLFDSYMSYLELDKEKKEVVFQQYQKSQTPDIDIIEGMISRLSR